MTAAPILVVLGAVALFAFRRRPWPLILRRFLIVLPFTILFLAAIPLPMGGVYLPSPEKRQQNALNWLGVFFTAYARQHDGNFPRQIADAKDAADAIFPQGTFEKLFRQFHDPADGKPSDWLYFPGYTFVDHDWNTTQTDFGLIVAAAPRPFGWFYWTKNRIVLLSNGHAYSIPEPTFHERISNQLGHDVP